MNYSLTQRLGAMLKIQAIELKRDYGALILSFAFPFVFVVSIFLSTVMNPVTKFTFGVVDPSHNGQAQVLVDSLTSTPSVDMRSVSHEDGLAGIKDGTLHALIVVPKGDFLHGAQPLELTVAERYKAIADIIMQATSARLAGKTSADRVQFEVVVPDEKQRSDLTYVFPGILAVALLQMGLFVTAVPMLHARDRGTYRYLSLTPLSVPEFLCSQIVFRYLISMLQVCLLLLAGSFMLKLTFGIWAAVIGVASLGVLLMVSIGYLIAGTASGLQLGMAMVTITELGMLWGGGVFSSPKGSALTMTIAHFIPLSYLADMFRQVITDMPGLWPLWLDALAILGWSALALLLTARKFRFDTPLSEAGARLGNKAKPASSAA